MTDFRKLLADALVVLEAVEKDEHVKMLNRMGLNADAPIRCNLKVADEIRDALN